MCNNNWWWIIILALLFGDNGCNSGCPNGGGGGNNFWWIIILALLFGDNGCNFNFGLNNCDSSCDTCNSTPCTCGC